MPTFWGEVTQLGAVKPYARWSEELREAFRPGERLRFTVERDRNGKFNSMFHLMLDLLAKAINRGPAEASVDSLKQWIKLKKGWYDVVKLPAARGEITHAISFQSTAFAKMGEDDFKLFALDACELIATELAPWIKGAPEYADVMALIRQINPEVV